MNTKNADSRAQEPDNPPDRDGAEGAPNAVRPNPDKAALAKIGARVRERLAADPLAYKLETDIAEIYAIGDFLSPGECKQLIAMIDDVAEPSTLYDKQAMNDGFRTSYSGNFDPYDPFVKGISRKIDDVLGMEAPYGETIQGQRYAPGQEFKPHNDWLYTDQHYWIGEEKNGGQRSWTAMVFLNDVEEGGDTHFTAAGLAIKPQTGALLLWNNALPNGDPNEGTMHAGTPVTKGKKYVLTKWYRARQIPSHPDLQKG